MTRPQQGHRGVPHTADLRIEAWAPDRAACLRESVAGLVDSVADVADLRPERTIVTEVSPSGDEDALVRVLDEVIYLLDTEGTIPIDAEVTETTDGYLLRLPVLPVRDVQLSTVPKAVTLQDLRFASDGREWTCAATIDV